MSLEYEPSSEPLNRFDMTKVRFRRGLVCEAHRLLYHSTLGLRVIKKKEDTTKLPPLPSQQGTI